MQERNQEEIPRPPISRIRKIVILRDQAFEGDEPGIIENIDLEELTEDGMEETTITRYTYCVGCNRVIMKDEDINARCVGCGGVLCPACGSVFCANEHCKKAVCASCRDIWGGQVFCKQHAKEEFIKRICAFFGVVMFVGLMVLVLWNLIL